MKFLFFILALLLAFILTSISATLVPLEGKLDDDWRLWWSTKVLGSEAIANFTVYQPTAEPVYFYNPIEWNEDGISRVSYESCVDIDELIANYQVLLKGKGTWKRVNEDFQDLSTVTFENSSNRLNQKSLIISQSAKQCAQISYTERTPKDL